MGCTMLDTTFADNIINKYTNFGTYYFDGVSFVYLKGAGSQGGNMFSYYTDLTVKWNLLLKTGQNRQITSLSREYAALRMKEYRRNRMEEVHIRHWLNLLSEPDAREVAAALQQVDFYKKEFEQLYSEAELKTGHAQAEWLSRAGSGTETKRLLHWLTGSRRNVMAAGREEAGKVASGVARTDRAASGAARERLRWLLGKYDKQILESVRKERLEFQTEEEKNRIFFHYLEQAPARVNRAIGQFVLKGGFIKSEPDRKRLETIVSDHKSEKVYLALSFSEKEIVTKIRNRLESMAVISDIGKSGQTITFLRGKPELVMVLKEAAVELVSMTSQATADAQTPVYPFSAPADHSSYVQDASKTAAWDVGRSLVFSRLSEAGLSEGRTFASQNGRSGALGETARPFPSLSRVQTDGQNRRAEATEPYQAAYKESVDLRRINDRQIRIAKQGKVDWNDSTGRQSEGIRQTKIVQQTGTVWKDSAISQESANFSILNGEYRKRAADEYIEDVPSKKEWLNLPGRPMNTIQQRGMLTLTQMFLLSQVNQLTKTERVNETDLISARDWKTAAVHSVKTVYEENADLHEKNDSQSRVANQGRMDWKYNISQQSLADNQFQINRLADINQNSERIWREETSQQVREDWINALARTDWISGKENQAANLLPHSVHRGVISVPVWNREDKGGEGIKADRDSSGQAEHSDKQGINFFIRERLNAPGTIQWRPTNQFIWKQREVTFSASHILGRFGVRDSALREKEPYVLPLERVPAKAAGLSELKSAVSEENASSMQFHGSFAQEGASIVHPSSYKGAQSGSLRQQKSWSFNIHLLSGRTDITGYKPPIRLASPGIAAQSRNRLLYYYVDSQNNELSIKPSNAIYAFHYGATIQNSILSSKQLSASIVPHYDVIPQGNELSIKPSSVIYASYYGATTQNNILSSRQLSASSIVPHYDVVPQGNELSIKPLSVIYASYDGATTQNNILGNKQPSASIVPHYDVVPQGNELSIKASSVIYASYYGATTQNNILSSRQPSEFIAPHYDVIPQGNELSIKPSSVIYASYYGATTQNNILSNKKPSAFIAPHHEVVPQGNELSIKPSSVIYASYYGATTQNNILRKRQLSASIVPHYDVVPQSNELSIRPSNAIYAFHYGATTQNNILGNKQPSAFIVPHHDMVPQNNELIIKASSVIYASYYGTITQNKTFINKPPREFTAPHYDVVPQGNELSIKPSSVIYASYYGATTQNNILSNKKPSAFIAPHHEVVPQGNELSIKPSSVIYASYYGATTQNNILSNRQSSASSIVPHYEVVPQGNELSIKPSSVIYASYDGATTQNNILRNKKPSAFIAPHYDVIPQGNELSIKPSSVIYASHYEASTQNNTFSDNLPSAFIVPHHDVAPQSNELSIKPSSAIYASHYETSTQNNTFSDNLPSAFIVPHHDMAPRSNELNIKPSSAIYTSHYGATTQNNILNSKQPNAFIAPHHDVVPQNNEQSIKPSSAIYTSHYGATTQNNILSSKQPNAFIAPHHDVVPQSNELSIKTLSVIYASHYGVITQNNTFNNKSPREFNASQYDVASQNNELNIKPLSVIYASHYEATTQNNTLINKQPSVYFTPHNKTPAQKNTLNSEAPRPNAIYSAHYDAVTTQKRAFSSKPTSMFFAFRHDGIAQNNGVSGKPSSEFSAFHYGAAIQNKAVQTVKTHYPGNPEASLTEAHKVKIPAPHSPFSQSLSPFYKKKDTGRSGQTLLQTPAAGQKNGPQKIFEDTVYRRGSSGQPWEKAETKFLIKQRQQEHQMEETKKVLRTLNEKIELQDKTVSELKKQREQSKSLSGVNIDQVVKDVMKRMEQQMKLERMRRGL